MEDHMFGRKAFSQNRENVFMGITIMDHQCLAGGLGDLDVGAEPVSLKLARRAVPVVVQAGLADRPYLRQRREAAISASVPSRPAGLAAALAVSFGWIATAA